MREQDWDRWIAMYGDLRELHGRPESAGATKMAWDALRDYDLDEVAAAIQELAGKIKRLPTPADIRAHIDGPEEDQAEIAWMTVQDEMSARGMYRSVSFQDPATMLAIQGMGGWVALCQAPDDAWTRKRFLDLHRTHSRTIQRTGEGTTDVPAYLPGIHETERGGSQPQAPVAVRQVRGRTLSRRERDIEEQQAIQRAQAVQGRRAIEELDRLQRECGLTPEQVAAREEEAKAQYAAHREIERRAKGGQP